MLRAGVDKAEKEIKKLPKELKELSKYKAYELVVVNFKESLPVIVNLKNDAVKQARARRFEVLRCLHFVDVTRVHQTRSWVVSFSSLRPFGPNRDAPRRSTASTRPQH